MYFKALSKNGTAVIEVQYLLNTIKDLTFDNIYHEHYNYWSLTSLKFSLTNCRQIYLEQKKLILMAVH